jgi:membrane fusion protein (multidrug efflux system)
MKHFYRIFLRGLFLVALPAGGIAFGTDYWIKSTRYVTTDNAYIKAHLLSISADLDGRATKVFVKQNDVVRMGDPLLDVDPEPFRIMLAKAEAELNSIKYEIKALQAELAEATAELSEVRAEITYLARVHGRQEKLYAKGISSRAKLDETERELTLTKQRARTVQHKIRRVMAKLGGSKNRRPEKHPMYLEAKAKVESAKLDLRRTRVFSPANGTVGKFSLQPGEFVERGRSLIPIIQSDEQWVEANLKETQLTHVRTGQRVEVIIDAYPDEPHEAQIVSISPSTGAELSILPPQNASGNWVKVVQRVPVKIEIADQEIIGKLRAGMTAHISIDTERRRSLFKIIKTAIAGSDIIE